MKRVLIISYYWPPFAGSGVQRWLKFAKYLPEYGWQPIIYTPENPDFDLSDESLLEGFPENIEVVKRKIWEPYSLYRLFSNKTKAAKQSNAGVVKSGKQLNWKTKLVRWIRGNFFVPDPRVFWVKPSIKFLQKYLKENPVDLVITTSPPNSMHLIGLGLKRQLGIPWIVDIRDPWSKLDFLDTFFPSERTRKKQERMESEVLHECDIVTATSFSMPNMLMPFDLKKFRPITNGYDENDFLSVNESPIRKSPKFRIAHIGLLNELRNPEALWKALIRYGNENQLFFHDLEIHLAGIIDPSIISSLKESKLGAYLIQESYLTHKEVLERYKKAAVLLLLVNNSANASVNIPGKLFEYLATKRPVLGIGKTDCDAAKIVQQCSAGYFANYDEEEKIHQQVKSLYLDWKNDEGATTTQTEQFSRRALTRDLVAVLNKLND